MFTGNRQLHNHSTRPVRHENVKQEVEVIQSQITRVMVHHVSRDTDQLWLTLFDDEDVAASIARTDRKPLTAEKCYKEYYYHEHFAFEIYLPGWLAVYKERTLGGPRDAQVWASPIAQQHSPLKIGQHLSRSQACNDSTITW